LLARCEPGYHERGFAIEHGRACVAKRRVEMHLIPSPEVK
jgi:hypothetical protein